MAAGDEFALLAGKGRIVGDEMHRHGGRIDMDERQGPGIVRVGKGNPHGDVVHAGHGHNVPGAGRVDRYFPVPLKPEYLGDAGRREAAVPICHPDILIDIHGAVYHLADAELAQIRGVIDGVHLELKHGLRVTGRRWDMGDDFFKERRHGSTVDGVVRIVEGVADFGRGKDHREIEQFVRCLQLNEQIEYLVHGPVRPGRWPVNLVDHYQHWKRDG